MHRIYEKRDNQPVSMIYDNPTSESFTKFRELIRKSSEEQMKNLAPKKSGFTNKYNVPTSIMQRAHSLIGASTMGSPVKMSKDEISKLNSYSENIQANNSIKAATQLQHIMLVSLPIRKMSLNNISLGTAHGGEQPKKSTNKSITKEFVSGGNDNEAVDFIISMGLTINIAKRKFIFEYDVDRNNDDDGMMEEDSHTHGNQSNLLNDGQKVKLEINFSSVEEMDMFSDTNSLQFQTSSWQIFEIYQENTTKPITWEPSNMKRLLNRSLPIGEDTKLTFNVCLRQDKFGKNLCTRISTLDRMLGAGLQFSVDGRQQRMMGGGIRINAGQKFLPSRQEPVKAPEFISTTETQQTEASESDKLGFNETGLREIVDQNELKNLKNFEREISESK